MTLHSVQPSNQIFIKGYRFLSFAKNTRKNIGKNTSKNVLITLNNQPEMHLKLLQKEKFKRQLKLLVDLNGNKIASKITKKITTKYLRES